MVPSARFDNLSPGQEHAFVLTGFRETIVAHRIDDVGLAIRRVCDARRDGLWAAGFVAYEAAPGFDSGLKVRDRPDGDQLSELPLVWFATFEGRAPVTPFRARRGSAGAYSVSGWAPDADAEQWNRGIAQIHERIGMGDTYQVNHTFRLRAAFSGDPAELYRDLALAQRGSYSAWLNLGRFQIASASPELFFDMSGGRMTVKPMKGTIRRGRWPAEDADLARQLETSVKDQAENLMIVDLLRSDLGRIASFGSVRAERLLTLERYETLWTLTSEITAQVPESVGLFDVFTALFPSGSVTGAPKASTMGIIAELERTPRGVYCGAIGYVAPGDGDIDARFNVAIRTVVVDGDEGIAQYGVGGGITWDSDASNEYEEARTKARLLVERRPEFDLLETLRWDEAEGFLMLGRHLERLGRSAGYFGFAFDRDHVGELLAKSVSSLRGSARVRLLLNREGAAVIEVDERVVAPFAHVPSGPVARVALGAPDVKADDIFLFHKTTRRRLYEAQRDAHPYAEDVLMVNDRGELTESTIANVAVRFGDVWWTPGLGSGALPGIYRAELLDRSEIGERTILRDELVHADEIALINSVRGWRRARIVGEDDE